MEILAKKLEKDGQIIATQNLCEHTKWVIEEALKLVDKKSLEVVSDISGFEKEKILDLIFFSAYFHDIGKATKEFQATIRENINSYHSLYSSSVLVSIEDFDFEEEDRYVNLLFTTVLTHHTFLPYRVKEAQFNFLDNAKDFFYGYKKSYEMFLKKECKYNFYFEIEKNIKIELEALEEDLKYIKSKHKLRTIYSYVSGILNLADWLASARFNKTYTSFIFDVKPTKDKLIKKFSFSKLRDFQEKLSITQGNVLVEIPTGEGKTEGSLLWAVGNIYNQNSKIIYTLPTQTTSNKLYERVQKTFDKSKCGLIHSASKVYLEKEYESENGVVDDKFRSDFLFNKTFSKPITVSTIDSLLKYFINIGRFNIAMKNYLNSVIIIDEIHAYDLKLMGFLKRFLELCNEYNVPVCIMSASIPAKIKELLGISNYPLITQKELFKKKANTITKVNNLLDDDLEKIIKKHSQGKNVLVIRNRVKSAKQTYMELKNLGVQDDEILLYHSNFKKRDRIKKETLIFEKLKNKKPFILVATQVVEMSLDIDFDVMFSDIAPIDALIQRFGRVNRKKLEDKIGEIFIYKVENAKPYRDSILDLTFETIQNGCYELEVYNDWLNSVYDRLFKYDVTIKNELIRLFEEAYKRYDFSLQKLSAIKKSCDNYDLRDIEIPTNDYILYKDYISGYIDYEYTISLPIFLEEEHIYHPPKEIKEKLHYKILDLGYSFDTGIILDNETEELCW